ncbi:hypothetical protein [Cupriavidus sp. 8B]
MSAQEFAGSIGAIDFETLIGNELMGQAKIVKDGCKVNDLPVVLQLPPLPKELGEPPGPVDVVQHRFRVHALDE